MKQAMINYIKNEKNDELYTPSNGVVPIIPYIDPSWVCWEPCDAGKSNITKLLRENGNKVITSHIADGQDFFTYEPKEDYDIIITNPPYSIKTAWIERCYALDKKFALLMPITTLEGVARGEIYRKHNDLELLVLDRRLEYIEGKKRNWFNTSWYFRGVLPEKLMFHKLAKV